MNIRRLGTPLIHALPIGLRGAARQFAAEMVILKHHRRGLIEARKYRERRGMAMHLGSGDKIKEGWVNIDLNPTADLTLDLREPLPFPDNTFRIIYSEHLLEHFDYPRDITNLLSECYRVLEPGGIHSFGVPDGELELLDYITWQNAGPALAQLYADEDRANLRWGPSWCRTRMDRVNNFMRQNGEHRWCYDEETMRLLLESVGFVEIQRREFDPELDQELRRSGTMYMRCKKPEVIRKIVS